MSPQSLLDKDERRTAYSVAIMEGVTETPKQPEPLVILRRLRRFELAYWRGGYADQPYILMAELNVVIEAEIEHSNLLAQNRLMKAMQDASQTP